MIRYRWYRSGDVFGIRYEMELDDYLPTHTHERETLHNVIVLEGAADFKTLGTTRLLVAGEIFDFDGALEHKIVSTSPRTVLLNLFLHGIPEEYKTLPASEHAGTFDPRGRE